MQLTCVLSFHYSLIVASRFHPASLLLLLLELVAPSRPFVVYCQYKEVNPMYFLNLNLFLKKFSKLIYPDFVLFCFALATTGMLRKTERKRWCHSSETFWNMVTKLSGKKYKHICTIENASKSGKLCLSGQMDIWNYEMGWGGIENKSLLRLCKVISYCKYSLWWSTDKPATNCNILSCIVNVFLFRFWSMI